jgi:hypothetical protein
VAASSRLTWRLTRTATTTLELLDSDGATVRTVWAGRAQAAGTRSWTWGGRLADGTMVAQGRYTARLTVVSAYGTQVLTRSVWAAAFPATLSATTLTAGQTLTVRFTTTEALRTRPKVTLTQPGLAPVTVTATRLADGSYRARFTVQPGDPGDVSLRIAATDTHGHTNATTYHLALGT